MADVVNCHWEREEACLAWANPPTYAKGVDEGADVEVDGVTDAGPREEYEARVPMVGELPPGEIAVRALARGLGMNRGENANKNKRYRRGTTLL